MTEIALPRFPLAQLPTPLETLPRLRAALAAEAGGRPVPALLVKRDDMTGLASGGNKTRKLETLLAVALAEGADTLVTVGAPQSNHCRQTAAAAAKAGLRCVLVLGGTAPMLDGGNLLLDRLLGAEIVWAGPRDRLAVLDETVDVRALGRLAAIRHHVRRIEPGGRRGLCHGISGRRWISSRPQDDRPTTWSWPPAPAARRLA